MFIARISRGRTIRQFVGGVILVPSAVSLVWFAIFGGTAMKLQERRREARRRVDARGPAVRRAAASTRSRRVTSLLVMILVGIFFVSGADAASIVMGTLSQKGTLEPSRFVVIFWGVLTGAVAAIMLLVGGGRATRSPACRTSRSWWRCRSSSSWSACVSRLMRDLRRDSVIVREAMGSRPSNSPSSPATRSTTASSRSGSARRQGTETEGDPIGHRAE